MNTNPDQIACDWTRARLPLLVEEGVSASSDGGSLCPEDRLSVENHLDRCDGCRMRRASLSRAMQALGSAATESPVEPHAPSLWRSLESRIEVRQAAPPSFWTRLANRALPLGLRPAWDRLVGRLDDLRDELPMRRAWIRDTIREDLPERVRELFNGDRAAAACDRLLRPLAVPLGLGAAAALVAFIALPWLSHERTVAESRIAAAAAPIPMAVEPIPPILTPNLAEALATLDAAEARALDSADSPDASVVSSESLAQNTNPPTPDPSGQGQGQTAEKPATTASPAVQRYDFDLEHGIPMPPDARIGKPAY